MTIMQSSKLIDDLIFIANGDVALVERAILDSANADGRADLKDVVAYIVRAPSYNQQNRNIDAEG